MSTRPPDDRRASRTQPIEIEAGVIGAGLGIEPARVQAGLDAGAISILCERGVGEDLGRYRVTFHCGKRRLRLVVDADGRILETA